MQLQQLPADSDDNDNNSEISFLDNTVCVEALAKWTCMPFPLLQVYKPFVIVSPLVFTTHLEPYDYRLLSVVHFH